MNKMMNIIVFCVIDAAKYVYHIIVNLAALENMIINKLRKKR